MRSGLRPSIRSPSNVIEPLHGLISPETAFNSVDFPVPLPPSSATIWPRATLRLAPLRTWTLPYPPTTSLISSMSALASVRFFLLRRMLPTSCRPQERANLGIFHLLAEVRLDHAVVFLDRCRRSFGDLLAVLEHAHRLARLHHDLQDVLDDDQGETEALLESKNRVEHDFDIDRRQAGCRLVEQKKIRPH